MTKKPELHAIIGVIRRGDRALYFKRSEHMENYPGVWSLLSGRTSREELTDFINLEIVQHCADRISTERLMGTPLSVRSFLTSAYCDKPDHRLFLYMYEMDCFYPPELSPLYYSDAALMTPDEYKQASARSMCGLCMSMWSRYCVKHGIVDESFAEAHDLEPQGALYE